MDRGVEVFVGSADFSLEQFVEGFVRRAFSSITDGMSLDYFYATVIPQVSSDLAVCEKLVAHVHHPFHWELFMGREAPFLLESCRTGGRYTIKRSFDKDATQHLITQTTSNIIQTHCRENSYLPSRVNAFYQSLRV